MKLIAIGFNLLITMAEMLKHINCWALRELSHSMAHMPMTEYITAWTRSVILHGKNGTKSV
jgi:hypothetical protein